MLIEVSVDVIIMLLLTAGYWPYETRRLDGVVWCSGIGTGVTVVKRRGKGE